MIIYLKNKQGIQKGKGKETNLEGGKVCFELFS